MFIDSFKGVIDERTLARPHGFCFMKSFLGCAQGTCLWIFLYRNSKVATVHPSVVFREAAEFRRGVWR